MIEYGVAGIAGLRFGSAFQSVEARFSGDCRAITLTGSSEDIVIDRGRGIVYLSSLDRDSARRDELVLGYSDRLDKKVILCKLNH